MEDKSIKAVQQISTDDIKNRIYTIRGIQVMLDRDIAQLYGVETRRVNEQVKRNIERFPSEFMFQLNETEFKDWKSHFAMSNSDKMGLRRTPYVFTEQGVAMLATVLKSDTAIQVSIQIMKAFVSMRHFISDNANMLQRLRDIDLKLLEHDNNFKEIFKQLQNPKEAKAVLFFKGQMWDATSLIEDIIGKAKKSINLIDGYVDKKNLDLFSRKRKNVTVDLYTSKTGNKLTQKEVSDFNNQYGGLTIKYTNEFHDRFIILDEKELYHCGASIKDAGKKAFELSIIEDDKQLQEILKRLV